MRARTQSYVVLAGEAIISNEDKLDVLQRLDRRWHSLSDGVCCTQCGRVFAASEIPVLGGSRAFGPLRLHCPNDNCHSPASDWMRCQDRVVQAANVGLRPRMSVLKSRGYSAVTGLTRPARVLARALRQLDADWSALWQRVGRRLRPLA